MQNGLEKYIQTNRAAFDSEQPGEHVLQNLERAFVKPPHSLEGFVDINKDAFDTEEPGTHVWETLEKTFVAKPGMLEAFVQDNRDGFDTEEPGNHVWQQLEKTFVAKATKLEEFVQANRPAFDTEQPPVHIQQHIEQTFAAPKQTRTATTTRSLFVKISSVAAIIMLACFCTWYFTKNANNSGQQQLVANNTPTKPVEKIIDTPAQQQQLTTAPAAADKIASIVTPQASTTKEVPASNAHDDDYNQEIFYYTKLSEIKFNELKKIEKEQPALYKSFAGEIKKLDDNYHNLQAMLKNGADRESVLSAMIANLKMQTEILSKQLYIIHSLKQSKKQDNEPKDKSI